MKVKVDHRCAPGTPGQIYGSTQLEHHENTTHQQKPDTGPNAETLEPSNIKLEHQTHSNFIKLIKLINSSNFITRTGIITREPENARECD